MDMFEAAPRLPWRCRPMSAGVSDGGAAAAPNENVGGTAGRDAAAMPLLMLLPKGVLPPAPLTNDGGREMEGVVASPPPGSLPGLAAPNEKLSGAVPEAELSAAAPKPGAGAVPAGAASTPPADAESPLTAPLSAQMLTTCICRWQHVHVQCSSPHEHLLRLRRRQTQSLQRSSWCQTQRLAGLRSPSTLWSQVPSCWQGRR
jgi:hypothetical protein